MKYLLISLMLVFPALAAAQSLVFENVESAGQSTYDFLEATPDGKFLYALNKGAASVESFNVSSAGALLPGSAITTPFPEIAEATSFAFNRSGDFILMGNKSTGALVGLYAYYRGEGGGFEAVEFHRSAVSTTPDSMFDDVNVTDVKASPDGKNIYVAGTRIGGLDDGEGLIGIIGGVTYIPATKRIEYTELVVADRFVEQDVVSRLVNPVGMVVTSNNVFVISDDPLCGVATCLLANSDALLSFTRDSATGALTFQSSLTQDSGAVGLINPSDMVLLNSGTSSHLVVAVSDSLLQFEQASSSVSPFFKAIYNADSTPKVNGLVGVETLISNPLGGSLYAAAPSFNTITPLYLNDGALLPVQNDSLITQSTGTAGVQGLTGVNRLAIANERGHLYAASSTTASAKVGIARFSRQSNISVVVQEQSRRVIQPGQVAGFSVVATNAGPADAPGFVMTLSPSHTISAISGTDATSCETTVNSGATSISCTKAILANGATFAVNVGLLSRGITTARLNASASSRNEIPGAAIVASDSDETKVGEFKNGTLAVGAYLQLLLLGLFLVRKRIRYA